MKRAALFILLAGAMPASAAPTLVETAHAGASFGYNEVEGTVASAVQLSAGADFAPVAFIQTGLELGYLDTGDAPADGFWLTICGRYPVAPDMNIIARAGIDYGDNGGGVAGLGIGYAIERNMEVRFEGVRRDAGSVAWLIGMAYYPAVRP